MYNSTENKKALEYYEKGEEQSLKQEFKTAIKWYKKAVDEDPKFVEAYDNMGVAYRNLGDFDNAKKAYNKSIELYPEGKMAHQNIGLIYTIEKNYEKALEEYGKVQKIDSTDAEGYYGTIQIYINQKDYPKAIRSAAKTLEIYEATNNRFLSDAQYLLGVSYYLNGDKKNATIYLKQAKANGVAIPKDLKDELGL